jgi:hypothetical protein
MKEDLSVPPEFEKYSKALFKKTTITKREFVELCLLAAKFIDTHWEQRQGMAYHITGAWFYYKNIDTDDLLDQIGAECGSLEVPDEHVIGGSKEVRKKWQELKELIKEADERFPKQSSI